MIKGFYTGTTGAIEHQKMMAVTANNIANSLTPGYKSTKASFQDLLYKQMRMPDGYPSDGKVFSDMTDTSKASELYYSESKLKVGAGARVAATPANFASGSLTVGSQYDAAINGEGFFAVQGSDGNIYYTRDGAFRASNENGTLYLVNAHGEYVLDENYNPITLPQTGDGFSYISPSETQLTDNEVKIGVFSCDNIYGLSEYGNNKFQTTAFSGDMSPVSGDVKIVTGMSEASNVSLADEMTDVIKAQRSYQVNLAVIRTADELESYTIAMRG